MLALSTLLEYRVEAFKRSLNYRVWVIWTLKSGLKIPRSMRDRGGRIGYRGWINALESLLKSPRWGSLAMKCYVMHQGPTYCKSKLLVTDQYNGMESG